MTRNRVNLCTVSIAAPVFTLILAAQGSAQETLFNEIAQKESEELAFGEEAPVDPSKVKTIDDVRKIGGWENSMIIGVPADVRNSDGVVDTALGVLNIKGDLVPPDPRAQAKKQLDKLRKQLDAEPTKELKSRLKEALMQYFLADMRHRVRELDEIKEKTKRMEKQLNRRLGAKEKVVELQLEVLLNQAAGLGFFAPEKRNRKRSLASGFGNQLEVVPAEGTIKW